MTTTPGAMSSSRGNTNDNHGRRQQDDDWYERQEYNPGLKRHHGPYQTTVDYNCGLDPWRAYNLKGSDSKHYRNYHWGDWAQTYVNELNGGSNSNTAHGNRGTENRHRQPRNEACRPQTGNSNPRHQTGTSGVFNNKSSDYHHIAPGTRLYSEVLDPPTLCTRHTVSTDVHPDIDVSAGETQTDDQSSIESTSVIHVTRKDIT